jgi:two-component system LytT family response regulator
MQRLPNTLRVLVVDDESHGRRSIRRLLEANSNSYVIDEACDGTEATEKIPQFEPDLVILDIEMPSANGFDVLKNFPNRSFEVIFVTAYPNFAIQAFDSYVADYVLKPVHAARFETALARAKERLAARRTRPPQETQALQSPASGYIDSFFVKQGPRASQIFCKNVVLILATEGGTEIQTRERAYFSDITLAHFEKDLDPSLFCRVRRNTIVHRQAITKVMHRFPMVLIMSNGTEVSVAKDRRSEVRHWLIDEHPPKNP